MTYLLFVDDNFHFMDEGERTGGKRFERLDEALNEARDIVDECLAGMIRPGMTASELYEQYTLFGDDPFISRENPPKDAPKVTFSAWEYAKDRCGELCSGDMAHPSVPSLDSVKPPLSSPQQAGGPLFVIGTPDLRQSSRIVWRGATVVERTGSRRPKPQK